MPRDRRYLYWDKIFAEFHFAHAERRLSYILARVRTIEPLVKKIRGKKIRSRHALAKKAKFCSKRKFSATWLYVSHALNVTSAHARKLSNENRHLEVDQ